MEMPFRYVAEWSRPKGKDWTSLAPDCCLVKYRVLGSWLAVVCKQLSYCLRSFNLFKC